MRVKYTVVRTAEPMLSIQGKPKLVIVCETDTFSSAWMIANRIRFRTKCFAFLLHRKVDLQNYSDDASMNERGRICLL